MGARSTRIRNAMVSHFVYQSKVVSFAKMGDLRVGGWDGVISGRR